MILDFLLKKKRNSSFSKARNKKCKCMSDCAEKQLHTGSYKLSKSSSNKGSKIISDWFSQPLLYNQINPSFITLLLMNEKMPQAQDSVW